MQTLRKLEESPHVLMIHFGGNDLGAYSVGDLRIQLKLVLQNLHKMFPKTKLIWSQILPRKNWRYSQNKKAMERSRARINSAIATETIKLGGAYVKYPDIKCASIELWADDGVHLSTLGNEIFLNTIQGALQSFVESRTVVYPY